MRPFRKLFAPRSSGLKRGFNRLLRNEIHHEPGESVRAIRPLRNEFADGAVSREEFLQRLAQLTPSPLGEFGETYSLELAEMICDNLDEAVLAGTPMTLVMIEALEELRHEHDLQCWGGILLTTLECYRPGYQQVVLEALKAVRQSDLAA